MYKLFHDMYLQLTTYDCLSIFFVSDCLSHVHLVTAALSRSFFSHIFNQWLKLCYYIYFVAYIFTCCIRGIRYSLSLYCLRRPIHASSSIKSLFGEVIAADPKITRV